MEKIKELFREVSLYVQSHKKISLIIGLGVITISAILIMILVLRRKAKPPPNSSPPIPPEKPEPPGILTGLNVDLESTDVI